MKKRTTHILLLAMLALAGPACIAAGPKITSLDVAPDGEAVRINVELTAQVTPTFFAIDDPCRLYFEFPRVTLLHPVQRITVNHAGVGELHVEMSRGASRIWFAADQLPRFGINALGNKVVLTIFPQPLHAANTCARAPAAAADRQRAESAAASESSVKLMATLTTSAPPQVDPITVNSSIDEPPIESPLTVRRRFRIKFVSGNTAYIDGGSNSGLRAGMNFDIWSASANSGATAGEQPAIGTARVVGVATSSAILQVDAWNGDAQVGEVAELLPRDAEAARKNVRAAPGNSLHVASNPMNEDPDSSLTGSLGLRRTQPNDGGMGTRTAGRIGFDYSGISSSGSTPGNSMQLGMSFQSNIQHILGSHWNLEGYWRGRINRHAQFQEDTLEDTLNKTYTMQLYYDNPQAKWVAGLGRLYLPWAVSLDTIDGGYFGRKLRAGNTTGVFAGSTPDLTSWHYRPDQRIAGVFTNFQGGDYDRIHYSSTTGAALTSVKWRLDRPFVFFENEISYKGKLSAYHSLIADSPQGTSTHGIRPGAGVSHSYFTLHYQPYAAVSFDLYHNFFRDVPTALTPIAGTGLVDKLLFQGISAGTHVKPTRFFTLYTTLGASEKTGDTRRSVNEMFGATWNEIARSGLRADFHYSKFDSNFGSGHYEVLSLSRQLTNRMFWNLQLGKQDVLSSHTLDAFSDFVDDAVDVNLGRHSYLQSGYTYVRGASMNYRQWYMSWGFRLDEGRKVPQYVQTLVPQN